MDATAPASAAPTPGPLRLRRATTADAGAVARMMGDDAVYPGLMQLPFPSAEPWATRLAGNNAPAIALYRRLGFEVEGKLRGYALRQGMYEDVLSMARWHPRPPVRR